MMVSFQEHYKHKTKSDQRIADAKIPAIEGKYDLVAAHVNKATLNINSNIKKILDELGENIDGRLFFSMGGSDPPEFLKPTETYADPLCPEELKGSRYILAGWDLELCLNDVYRRMLRILDDRCIEMHIPFGAAEYEKLLRDGGTPGLDNILYLKVVSLYFKDAIDLQRSPALYFDGELLDVYRTPNTILYFYSTTDKFLELNSK